MMMPELPQHAADAAGRAHHGAFGTVVALAAVAATVFVLAFTEPTATRAPPPTAAPDTSLCEADGTFCEPAYLQPPAEHGPSGRLPDGMVSGRSTPAG